MENSKNLSNEKKGAKKKLIGLTGKYCAGKNHVALILEKRSIPVLDVDKLGHLVIERQKKRLLQRFGEDILDAKGQIDRKELGKRVFGRPIELAALEEIIHPLVNEETLSWLDGREEEVCVVNAALLHRSTAFGKLDAVIFVEAPFITRLLRARSRDRLPLATLLKRLHSQGEISPQFFRGKTDIYRVKNSVFSGFGETGKNPDKRLEERLNEILSFVCRES